MALDITLLGRQRQSHAPSLRWKALLLFIIVVIPIEIMVITVITVMIGKFLYSQALVLLRPVALHCRGLRVRAGDLLSSTPSSLAYYCCLRPRQHCKASTVQCFITIIITMQCFISIITKVVVVSCGMLAMVLSPCTEGFVHTVHVHANSATT